MGVLDLFRPKWKHSDSDVRMAAAKELDDVEILKQMAGHDKDWFVRHGVFDLLRSRDPGDDIYAYLAKDAMDEEIRRKAIKRLRDEETLKWVAKNDKYRYIRDAAEHRLEELRSNLYGEDTAASEKAQA